MDTEIGGRTDDGPLAPLCPRCERRDEVTPTFERLQPWECWWCELRFSELVAYL